MIFLSPHLTKYRCAPELAVSECIIHGTAKIYIPIRNQRRNQVPLKNMEEKR